MRRAELLEAAAKLRLPANVASAARCSVLQPVTVSRSISTTELHTATLKAPENSRCSSTVIQTTLASSPATNARTGSSRLVSTSPEVVTAGIHGNAESADEIKGGDNRSIDPRLADELIPFLDTFGTPTIKCVAESKLLADGIVAELGGTIDREATAMYVREIGLTRNQSSRAEPEPTAVRFGTVARVYAAYGSKLKHPMHKYGPYVPQSSQDFAWALAVHAAASGPQPAVMLGALEAQLLDLRVAHAFFFPQDTAQERRMPVDINRLNVVEAETAGESERKAIYDSILDAFPAPPETSAGTYVSFAADLLGRFGITPASHPALWAGLRADARVEAYLLAVLLNKHTVHAYAEQAARRHTPAKAGGPQDKAERQKAGSAVVEPPPAAYRQAPASVQRYLSEARRVLVHSRVLGGMDHDGPSGEARPANRAAAALAAGSSAAEADGSAASVSKSGRAASPAAVSSRKRKGGVGNPASGGAEPQAALSSETATALRHQAKDMDISRLKLLSLEGEHGPSLSATVLPVLCSYLNDRTLVTEAVGTAVSFASECAIETAKWTLKHTDADVYELTMSESAKAATAAGRGPRSEVLAHMTRVAAAGPSGRWRVRVHTPGYGASIAAAVFDPAQALDTIVATLRLPEAAASRIAPVAVRQQIAAAARAHSRYALVQTYRQALEKSIAAVRTAKASSSLVERRALRITDGNASTWIHKLLQDYHKDTRRLSLKPESQQEHYGALQLMLGELAQHVKTAKDMEQLLELARGIEAEALRQIRANHALRVFNSRAKKAAGGWGAEMRKFPALLPFRGEDDVEAGLSSASSSSLASLSAAVGSADGVETIQASATASAAVATSSAASATGLPEFLANADEVFKARVPLQFVDTTAETARPLVHQFVRLLPLGRAAYAYNAYALRFLGFLRVRHVLDHPSMGSLAQSTLKAMERHEAEAARAEAESTASVPRASSDAFSLWAQLSEESQSLSRLVRQTNSHGAKEAVVDKASGRKDAIRGSAAASTPAGASAAGSTDLEAEPGVGHPDVTIRDLQSDVFATVARLEKLQKLPGDLAALAELLIPPFLTQKQLGVNAATMRESVKEALHQQNAGLDVDGLLAQSHSDPRYRVFAFVLRLCLLLPDRSFVELRERVAGLTASMVSEGTGNAVTAAPGRSPVNSTFRDVNGNPVKIAVGIPLLDGAGGFSQELRAALSLFSPLGHLLDDPFMHLLRRGWLTPQLFDVARLCVLKQYASWHARTTVAFRLEKVFMHNVLSEAARYRRVPSFMMNVDPAADPEQVAAVHSAHVEAQAEVDLLKRYASTAPAAPAEVLPQHVIAYALDSMVRHKAQEQPALMQLAQEAQAREDGGEAAGYVAAAITADEASGASAHPSSGPSSTSSAVPETAIREVYGQLKGQPEFEHIRLEDVEHIFKEQTALLAVQQQQVDEASGEVLSRDIAREVRKALLSKQSGTAAAVATGTAKHRLASRGRNNIADGAAWAGLSDDDFRALQPIWRAKRAMLSVRGVLDLHGMTDHAYDGYSPLPQAVKNEYPPEVVKRLDKLRLPVPVTAIPSFVPSVSMPARVLGVRRRRHIVSVDDKGQPQPWELDTLEEAISRTVFIQGIPIVGSSVKSSVESIGRREAKAEAEAETEGPKPPSSHLTLEFTQLVDDKVVRAAVEQLGSVERIQLLWGRSRRRVSALQAWLKHNGLAQASSAVLGKGKAKVKITGKAKGTAAEVKQAVAQTTEQAGASATLGTAPATLPGRASVVPQPVLQSLDTDEDWAVLAEMDEDAREHGVKGRFRQAQSIADLLEDEDHDYDRDFDENDEDGEGFEDGLDDDEQDGEESGLAARSLYNAASLHDRDGWAGARGASGRGLDGLPASFYSGGPGSNTGALASLGGPGARQYATLSHSSLSSAVRGRGLLGLPPVYAAVLGYGLDVAGLAGTSYGSYSPAMTAAMLSSVQARLMATKAKAKAVKSTSAAGEAGQGQEKSAAAVTAPVAKPAKSKSKATKPAGTATNAAAAAAGAVKPAKPSASSTATIVAKEPPPAQLISRSEASKRLRRFNLASDLHAFVRFDSDKPMSKITSDVMRYYGLTIAGQACPVSPASEATALHLSGLPDGITHDAAMVILADYLESGGIRLKLDHKGTGNSFQKEGATRPDEELRTPHRHNVSVNLRGELVMVLENHADAVRAAAKLKDLYLPPSVERVQQALLKRKREQPGAVETSTAITGPQDATSMDHDAHPTAPGAVQAGRWTPTLSIGWASLQEAKSIGLSRAEKHLPASR